MAASSGHRFMLCWYLVASGWHLGSLAPKKAIHFFPMDKKGQVQNVLKSTSCFKHRGLV